jgi:hypothetical protein
MKKSKKMNYLDYILFYKYTIKSYGIINKMEASQMKISIKRVSLENNMDVINYITKGMRPSKEDFNTMIGKIQAVDPNRNVFNTSLSVEELKLIYENKKENENRAAIFGLLLASMAFLFGVKKGKEVGFEECREQYDERVNDALDSAGLGRITIKTF